MSAFPKRALLVEDEFLVALLLEDFLAQIGIDVVSKATTAAEGLAALSASFDVAVLDVNLGSVTTTFEIADELQQMGIPFIFVTGYGRDGVATRFSHVPVLAKPVTQEMLQKAIHEAYASRAGLY